MEIKKLLICLCFTSCAEIVYEDRPDKLPKGVVRRIYETPTYKSYSTEYHIVIKTPYGGEDVLISKGLAAQYSVGDTIK